MSKVLGEGWHEVRSGFRIFVESDGRCHFGTVLVHSPVRDVFDPCVVRPFRKTSKGFVQVSFRPYSGVYRKYWWLLCASSPDFQAEFFPMLSFDLRSRGDYDENCTD